MKKQPAGAADALAGLPHRLLGEESPSAIPKTKRSRKDTGFAAAQTSPQNPSVGGTHFQSIRQSAPAARKAKIPLDIPPERCYTEKKR